MPRKNVGVPARDRLCLQKTGLDAGTVQLLHSKIILISQIESSP